MGSAGVWGLGSRKGSPVSQIEAYQRPENLISRAWIRSRNWVCSKSPKPNTDNGSRKLRHLSHPTAPKWASDRRGYGPRPVEPELAPAQIPAHLVWVLERWACEWQRGACLAFASAQGSLCGTPGARRGPGIQDRELGTGNLGQVPAATPTLPHILASGGLGSACPLYRETQNLSGSSRTQQGWRRGRIQRPGHSPKPPLLLSWLNIPFSRF